MSHVAAASIIPANADSAFLASLLAVAAGRHAGLAGARVTRRVMENVSAALTPMCAPAAPPSPPAAIIRQVAEKHGLTTSQMLYRSRVRSITDARQEAMWELRERTTLSLPRIGKALGGLHHTSVLYGIRAHAKRQAVQG